MFGTMMNRSMKYAVRRFEADHPELNYTVTHPELPRHHDARVYREDHHWPTRAVIEAYTGDLDEMVERGDVSFEYYVYDIDHEHAQATELAHSPDYDKALALLDQLYDVS